MKIDDKIFEGLPPIYGFFMECTLKEINFDSAVGVKSAVEIALKHGFLCEERNVRELYERCCEKVAALNAAEEKLNMF